MAVLLFRVGIWDSLCETEHVVVASHPDYPQTVSHLFSLQKYGIKLGLSNMQTLMSALDNPHLRFPSVLIGGTNGKGSTASFLQSILRESGYRTGLYTSPHLLDFRERIQIDGQAMTEEEMVEGVRRLNELISSLMAAEGSSPLRLPCHPTFFEVATALAFHHFARHQVEVAVVEVGMGGRYDATNVLLPALSIITNVDLDHQEYLGEGLQQIAREKAGIIKERRWVVTGVSIPEAVEIIEQVAQEREAHLCRLGTDITWQTSDATWQGQELSIRTRREVYSKVRIKLLGRHQSANAAAAVAAAEILRDHGFSISRESIYQGLEGASWPGRMQVLQDHPRIVVDSAHNPAGVRALSQTVLDLDAYRRLWLVFGVLRDKDWKGMLPVLAPLAHQIILTRPPSERAADPSTVKQAMEAELQAEGIHVREKVGEAISLAKSMASADDIILITGSLFTAAEALQVLGVRVL